MDSLRAYVRYAYALRKSQLLEDHDRRTSNGHRVVVISDTHGTEPEDIPSGEVLIHGGDFSQHSKNLQDQLNWLDKLPHPTKIIIAGNHETCLDSSLSSNTGNPNPAAQFSWGSLTYLENSSYTVHFPDGTSVQVYGSPCTTGDLDKGSRGFKHPLSEDVWSKTIPTDTGILVTHGPAKFHQDGKRNYGDAYLLAELWRVKPRLFIHGHIHAAAGRDILVYDAFQKAYEAFLDGSYTFQDVIVLICSIVVFFICGKFWVTHSARQTVIINAALNGSGKRKETSGPFVEHWS